MSAKLLSGRSGIETARHRVNLVPVSTPLGSFWKEMGYFIASCIVTWLILGFYALVLAVRIRRLSARVSKGAPREREENFRSVCHDVFSKN